jgi:hypothetical protein
MRYLTYSDAYGCALIAGVLLMLQATPVLALKPPGDVVQQPSPVPAEPPKVKSKKSLPADVTRTAPARRSPSERVQADSAVSFPVDI